MAEQVLAVRRAKRAGIAGQVHDTEKKLAELRAALANLDAPMAILTADHPDYIAGSRKHLRTAYFPAARNYPGLYGTSGEALTATEIAAHAVATKGLPACGSGRVHRNRVEPWGATGRVRQDWHDQECPMDRARLILPFRGKGSIDRLETGGHRVIPAAFAHAAEALASLPDRASFR
jgi:hypothetical protein